MDLLLYINLEAVAAAVFPPFLPLSLEPNNVAKIAQRSIISISCEVEKVRRQTHSLRQLK